MIECAFYLYEMLADGQHIERLGDDNCRLRPSFVALDKEGFFPTKQGWIAFAAGLIVRFGTAERSIVHRIRAAGE